MGDSSDNIPGVPGIGEKTAVKLIASWHRRKFAGAHVRADRAPQGERGKESGASAAFQAAGDAYLRRAVSIELESLKVQSPDEAKLKALLAEFEFNSIGKRLFGEGFKAGRGFEPSPARAAERDEGAGCG